MPFRILRNEEPAQGVKRIAVEQIDEALGHLRHLWEDPEEHVHEARKNFKRIRAVARLVRPVLGSKRYHQENETFRDIGRRFGPLRDDVVLVKTLAELRTACSDYAGKKVCDTLIASLRERNRVDLLEAERQADWIDESIEVLEAARVRVRRWPLKREGFDLFGPGLGKVYKRGRKAMCNAYEKRTTESFHDWRKRVKYLWYQTKILRTWWPAVMRCFADQIHDLANFLGTSHDLGVLVERVADHPDVAGHCDDRIALMAAIQRQRTELRYQALPLGSLVFAETQTAFLDRMRAYRDASLCDTRALPVAPPETKHLLAVAKTE